MCLKNCCSITFKNMHNMKWHDLAHSFHVLHAFRMVVSCFFYHYKFSWHFKAVVVCAKIIRIRNIELINVLQLVFPIKGIFVFIFIRLLWLCIYCQFIADEFWWSSLNGMEFETFLDETFYTLRESISESIHTEKNMIIVTVFLSIMNQMEFRFGHNQKENCKYDHIPFNSKWIRNELLRSSVPNVFEFYAA